MPSVRMVQMRSTLCHGPSWQNISSVGSVGENSRWFSQSLALWIVLTSPVLILTVKRPIGRRAAQRSSIIWPLFRGLIERVSLAGAIGCGWLAGRRLL